MVVINTAGKLKVLTDNYEGKAYNSPNDLWVDPKGGVYFTDPRYGDRSSMVTAEHVYYLEAGSDEPPPLAIRDSQSLILQKFAPWLG